MRQLNVFTALNPGPDFKYSDVVLLADHIVKYNPRVKVYCVCPVEEIMEGKNVTLIPAETVWPRWWIKMNFFSPVLKKYRPFMYMDLDTAVVGDIEPLFPGGDGVDRIINLRDFYKPHPTLANGVAWIPEDNPKVDRVWQEWIRDPEDNMKRFPRGDMFFIGGQIETDLFWQELTSDIITFKPRTSAGRIEWRRELNPGTKIVCFHGKPRIPEAAKSVPWVNQYVNYEL